MAFSKRLPNYLRRYRKKIGLKLKELAPLVGLRHNHSAARHERFKRLPPLRVALAYEIVFGIPVAEIFAGLYDEVERDVLAEARDLVDRLDASSGRKRHASRTAWLARINEMVANYETLL